MTLPWYKRTRAWQIYGRAVFRIAGQSPCVICRYSRFLLIGIALGGVLGISLPRVWP